MADTLRIGCDAVRALRNGTGLGNYSRHVLRALRHTGLPLELYLFSSQPPRPEFAALPAELGARLIRPRRWGARVPGLWRTWHSGRCARSYGVALYHGLSHEIPRDLPRTGIVSVVTFHDLLFETHPQFFPWLDRRSYRWRYRWSARHADAIVAVSRATGNQLITCYRIDPSRITVVPPPREEAFAQPVSPADQAAVRAQYRLPDEYLLSVGTLERRKNHQLLIAALARDAAQRLPPLVLIGRDGGAEAAIRRAAERAGVARRVHIVAGVPSADLPALMQGARMLLYPSTAEGFGMPIVEALTAGVPVVAADGEHLRDAGGPGSAYVNATSPDAWAIAVDRILHDSAVRNTMIARGREHAEQFRGDRVAARLLAVYRAVLGDRAPDFLVTDFTMKATP